MPLNLTPNGEQQNFWLLMQSKLTAVSENQYSDLDLFKIKIREGIITVFGNCPDNEYLLFIADQS